MNETLKVLYVENSKEDFDTVSLILMRSQNACFEIDWAKTPEDFCEKSSHDLYDAFIVDYRLGAINGLDLIKNCDIPVDKPIIILTAYGSEDLDEEALKAGASFFIDKDVLSDNWKILDKILRYSYTQGKRVYNSVRSGIQLQSIDDIEKVSKIIDFNYLKYMDTT